MNFMPASVCCKGRFVSKAVCLGFSTSYMLYQWREWEFPVKPVCSGNSNSKSAKKKQMGETISI